MRAERLGARLWALAKESAARRGVIIQFRERARTTNMMVSSNYHPRAARLLLSSSSGGDKTMHCAQAHAPNAPEQELGALCVCAAK